MAETWRSAFGRSIKRVTAIVLASLVVSCTPPQYDEQTDTLISTLQSDIDTELVTLISLRQRIDSLQGKTDPASTKALADARAKASYDANIAAYNKIAVDFTSAQLRIDAVPNSSTANLDKALQELHDNLFGDQSLQSTHQKEDVPSTLYLKNEKNIIDQQLEALLKYELVLKNGASGSSANSK